MDEWKEDVLMHLSWWLCGMREEKRLLFQQFSLRQTISFITIGAIVKYLQIISDQLLESRIYKEPLTFNKKIFFQLQNKKSI